MKTKYQIISELEDRNIEIDKEINTGKAEQQRENRTVEQF